MNNNIELEQLSQFIKENGPVRFRIHHDPDAFWAESTNIDSIYSSGETYDELMNNLKDAVFTYFGVPAKYCDERLLRVEGEAATELAYA